MMPKLLFLIASLFPGSGRCDCTFSPKAKGVQSPNTYTCDGKAGHAGKWHTSPVVTDDNGMAFYVTWWDTRC